MKKDDFQQNHVGSVKFVTDGGRSVVANYKYSPYGELLIAQSSGTNLSIYKYTAQEEDSSTGMYYYNARFYDPEIGRFISADSIVPDPTDTQDFNRYMYVGGNPVKYSDPSGYTDEWWYNYYNWYYSSYNSNNNPSNEYSSSSYGYNNPGNTTINCQDLHVQDMIAVNYTEDIDPNPCGCVSEHADSPATASPYSGGGYYSYYPSGSGGNGGGSSNSSHPGGNSAQGAVTSGIVNSAGTGTNNNQNNTQPTFVNPTDEQIRVPDPWGSGVYGARRDGGRRLHPGIDITGNGNVRLPMSGYIETIDDGLRVTGRVNGEIYCIRMLHIITDIDNGWFRAGTIVGAIRDLTAQYPGITNHVHLELYRIQDNLTTRLDPTSFFFP